MPDGPGAREQTMRERQTDVLVVGGGLGSCAAALAALALGTSVLLAEETDWIGGQFPGHAMPFDEEPRSD